MHGYGHSEIDLSGGKDTNVVQENCYHYKVISRTFRQRDKNNITMKHKLIHWDELDMFSWNIRGLKAEFEKVDPVY